MDEKDKALKSELIDLKELAYERELNTALRDLASNFEEWNEGKISSLTVNEALHRYHKDTAKELWHKYVPNNFNDLIVAQAIADGILDRSELSAELFQFLEPKINRLQVKAPKSHTLGESEE